MAIFLTSAMSMEKQAETYLINLYIQNTYVQNVHTSTRRKKQPYTAAHVDLLNRVSQGDEAAQRNQPPLTTNK